MKIDFQDLYLESINRIKENINFNYKERERQKTDEDKKFYDGIIMGLFECLDMMRSDFIIANDEEYLADVGLDFEPFEKWTAAPCSTMLKMTLIISDTMKFRAKKNNNKKKRSRQESLLLLIYTKTE